LPSAGIIKSSQYFPR